MDAIRVGNVILMKDKVISIQKNERTITVVTTICESNIGYDNEEDASKAFDMFYEQLNRKEEK